MPPRTLWIPSPETPPPALTEDIPPDDPLPTERQKLFDFNPPSIQRDGSRSPPTPTPSPPLHFLDSHIARNLTLKAVKILPSLVVDLYRALDSFSEQLDALDDSHFYVYADTYIPAGTDAPSIVALRRSGANMAASRIASKILLHNSQPELPTTLLHMDPSAHLKPTLVQDKFASQNLAFGVFLLPEELKRLNRKNRDTIKRLLKNFFQFNSRMVLCTNGRPLIDAMSGLETMGTFPWQLHSRYSNDALPVPNAQPLDAATALWTLPTTEGPRRSRRGRHVVAQRPKDVGPIDMVPERDGVYTPKCEDYVQKVIFFHWL